MYLYLDAGEHLVQEVSEHVRLQGVQLKGPGSQSWEQDRVSCGDHQLRAVPEGLQEQLPTLESGEGEREEDKRK